MVVCGAEVYDRVERHLGGKLTEEVTVHLVRDVSPNKQMLCVSFRLPKAVALLGSAVAASGTEEQDSEAVETLKKRQKTECADL